MLIYKQWKNLNSQTRHQKKTMENSKWFVISQIGHGKIQNFFKNIPFNLKTLQNWHIFQVSSRRWKIHTR